MHYRRKKLFRTLVRRSSSEPFERFLFWIVSKWLTLKSNGFLDDFCLISQRSLSAIFLCVLNRSNLIVVYDSRTTWALRCQTGTTQMRPRGKVQDHWTFLTVSVWTILCRIRSNQLLNEPGDSLMILPTMRAHYECGSLQPFSLELQLTPAPIEVKHKVYKMKFSILNFILETFYYKPFNSAQSSHLPLWSRFKIIENLINGFMKNCSLIVGSSWPFGRCRPQWVCISPQYRSLASSASRWESSQFVQWNEVSCTLEFDELAFIIPLPTLPVECPRVQCAKSRRFPSNFLRLST